MWRGGKGLGGVGGGTGVAQDAFFVNGVEVGLDKNTSPDFQAIFIWMYIVHKNMKSWMGFGKQTSPDFRTPFRIRQTHTFRFHGTIYMDVCAASPSLGPGGPPNICKIIVF